MSGVKVLKSLTILLPVYNDWQALEKLIPLIDGQLEGIGATTHVTIIDDGSTTSCDPARLLKGCHAIAGLSVLRLRRNLGHQRALAVGMCHTWEHSTSDAILIMDADGEDAPSDIPRLVQKHLESEGTPVIFAARKRRSESPFFRIFYGLYKAVYWLMTGRMVRVGNFSLVPRDALSKLVVSADLWNHYAASVYKTRVPTAYIQSERAKRLDGTSHMNFVALVTHGLSAISVYSDVAGVRLLILFGFMSLACLASLAVFAAAMLLSGFSIPLWAVLAGGLLLLLFFQMGLYALLACFMTLGARTSSTFLPQRDYAYYVREMTESKPPVDTPPARDDR